MVLLLFTAMRMKAEALPWKVILNLDYIYNRFIPATVSASSYKSNLEKQLPKDSAFFK